jgi:hypothetical protein
MTDTTIADPKTHPASVADGFLPAYRFMEFCSVASHVGKSMLADFTAQLLAQFGIPVKHVDGTEEKRVFQGLLKTAKNLPIIKIPAVAGESWQACQAAGLTMHEVVDMKAAALRQRFGSENRYLVSAFQMHVAAFWRAAESEMLRVLAGTDADPTR